MILVCDKFISERALLIRDAVFARGYPCAASSFDDISLLRPFRILISFSDVCWEIPDLSAEDVQVIVIGDADSVELVEHTDNVRAALREIRSATESIYGITEAKKSSFGFSLTPSLFLSNDFFTVNGNVIVPTKSEYMIFKYLTAFAGIDEYFSPETIARYCFPTVRAEKSVPSAAVHIANLNKKIAAVHSGRVIRSKRGHGYYAVKI